MAGVHIHDIESHIRLESQDAEDVVESHEAVESQDVEDVNANDGDGCSADKPHVGMEFTTHEDAFSFYNAYALVTGFGIRKTSSTMSRKEPKEVISRTFVCNKEGKKYLTDKGEAEREVARMRETRVGCNARMRITLTKSKTWIVSKFIEEHNGRELTSPDKVMKHRSHKTKHRSKSVKNLIECLHSEGMTPSNISRIVNVASGSHGERVTPQQCHDHLRTQRKNNMGHECFSIVQEFENKKLSDPEFYFAIELDHTGTMRSIFWADRRSRTSYLQFGDVIVFDVTYKTNKLCLPFAPFTGVNHHRQSTLFGCALLADEEEESFVWLFTEWLKCMHGQAPISIITDQDIAIGNAVRRVFPNTCHRFCSWHVGKHVVEQVPRLQRLYGEDFVDYYNRWYYSSTVQKAEQRWKELKEKYNIDENDSSWLSTMYQKRHHWIPAFLKGTFFAGMTSSQRSESINSFFDSYVNSHTRLSEFVSQYDKALAARRASELDEDFMTMNTKPVLCFSHSIEIQVGNCYTRRIFNMFQEELKGCLQLLREEEKKDASVIIYNVGLVNEERSKWHQVVYDQGGELKVNCTCALFETAGLLCKHILHIMMFAHQVQVIPERYILHRWTIDARYRNIGIGNIMLGRSSICNEDQWNILKTWAVRTKFNSALELTVGSNILLTELDAKLSEFMVKAEQKIKDKHIDDRAFVSQVGSNAHVSEMIDHVTIRDPPGPMTTKGRPSKASRLRSRKEEAIEKRQKQQRTCQRCFQKGHYRTSCTNPPATKQIHSEMSEHQEDDYDSSTIGLSQL